MPQHVQELTQQHRTVGHLTNLVQAQVGREKAQWLVMRTWMHEREQKGDVHHVDDKLWVVGIKNQIAKTMKAVAQGLQEREIVREMTARTDFGGLQASQHADTTREEGPEERQHP